MRFSIPTLTATGGSPTLLTHSQGSTQEMRSIPHTDAVFLDLSNSSCEQSHNDFV